MILKDAVKKFEGGCAYMEWAKPEGGKVIILMPEPVIDEILAWRDDALQECIAELNAKAKEQ